MIICARLQWGRRTVWDVLLYPVDCMPTAIKCKKTCAKLFSLVLNFKKMQLSQGKICSWSGSRMLATTASWFVQIYSDYITRTTWCFCAKQTNIERNRPFAEPWLIASRLGCVSPTALSITSSGMTHLLQLYFGVHVSDSKAFLNACSQVNFWGLLFWTLIISPSFLFKKMAFKKTKQYTRFSHFQCRFINTFRSCFHIFHMPFH